MSTGTRKANDLSRALAAAIRAERAAAGITQTDALKRAGINRTTYVLIEKGTKVPDMIQVSKIAAVFGLSLSELTARGEARMADRAERELLAGGVTADEMDETNEVRIDRPESPAAKDERSGRSAG